MKLTVVRILIATGLGVLLSLPVAAQMTFGGASAPEEPELSLTGRIHFNINTNDYAKTRAFYQRLGFVNAIGPFPETNTLAMAHSMGMDAPYRMYAEIIYLGPNDINPTRLHQPTGRMIDLIHWREPENVSPAYSAVNRLGIAKVVLASTNLARDLARMAEAGYEPIGMPAETANGEPFAVLRDPAGTFVEIRERLASSDSTAEPLGETRIAAIDHLMINVSDLKRSLGFYKSLGFEADATVNRTSSVAEANAYGLASPFRVREALLRHRGDGSRLHLTQWLTPSDLTPPHGLPINNPGIHRINYASADIDADVALLKKRGVPLVSPVVRCCDGEQSTMGIAVFKDPDGIFLQMLGAVAPRGN